LMPAMDGLSFLKLVKNLYPDVVRILLTGHADLQLAIQAINDGEVFRFLTKPWNDLELKVTLRHIFDFIDLRRENQVLLDTVKKQQSFISNLEKEHPGILQVVRDETGAIVLEDV
jgi:two-component system, probable response regulator PhcQ